MPLLPSQLLILSVQSDLIYTARIYDVFSTFQSDFRLFLNEDF